MTDLLDIEALSSEEILQYLDVADAMHEISQREIKRVPTLRGKTVINMFLEPSTRTRVSFEIAAKRLSADTINVSASGSSLSKAERLLRRRERCRERFPYELKTSAFDGGVQLSLVPASDLTNPDPMLYRVARRRRKPRTVSCSCTGWRDRRCR